MNDISEDLPLIIAGPLVRHIDADTLTLWLVSSKELSSHTLLQTSTCYAVKILLFDQDKKPIKINLDSLELIQFGVGKHCFICTIIIKQKDLLKPQQLYFYDIEAALDDNKALFASQLLPDMLYTGESYFSFKYSQKLSNVLHGSCRKAHFVGEDALPQLDSVIGECIANNEHNKRPDLILFTGDQVYVDDVAGPMLHAVHQVIQRLGLYHETFEGSTISHSEALFEHEHSFYKRQNLLPQTKENQDLIQSFFKGKRKPIFTSANAMNHLIALNEMIALYLLSWSSRLWPYIDLNKQNIPTDFAPIYANEKQAIINFSKGLQAVERALAHVPVYMIFDDHDVTDDWNLTRAWEEEVYNNPFSKKIVGNALTAYLLCQGIGNPRVSWDALLKPALHCFNQISTYQHNDLIDILLNHNRWHYKVDTQPPIQVLDTRTQRWRSESNKNKPSGLMDWEALCDLQHDIIGQKSVIMVSAAPVYGVKFIEMIQRIFIVFGGALLVDAENWMAHRGTANVMLNIFRHMKTPPNFIILSGDVHYSFVYDVSLRFKRNSPEIVQFTCSGMHNQFPDKLIKWFERLNRWLYGHRSPLNWLTKRRNMSIKERQAHVSKSSSQRSGATPLFRSGKDTVNGTSIGMLELNENGNEKSCKLLLADGTQVTFQQEG